MAKRAAHVEIRVTPNEKRSRTPSAGTRITSMGYPIVTAASHFTMVIGHESWFATA